MPDTPGTDPAHPFADYRGWRGADEIQKAIAASLPTLAQAAPQLYEDDVPTDHPIALYRVWCEVFDGYPPYVPQTTEDCVSFGHGHGNDLLQTIECFLGDLDISAIQETDTEWLYGASREIAGMLRSGGGSYGAAAVKAMQQWGMLPRSAVGPYSGQRADQWGRQGVPDALKQQAVQWKLGGAAAVASYDDILVSLNAGKPVTECSNFLPSGQRDAQGFCQPSGRGGHCQLIVGARFDRPGLAILNSWPKSFYSGPLALGIPENCYWVDRAIVERMMIPTQDNFALSGSPGFAKPKGLREMMRSLARMVA